jgi:O-antigen/teichoic acid export membrane protein
VLALGLDLGLSWRGFNPAVEPRLLAHRPAALAFLSTQTRGAMPARITSFEPRGVKTANANMLWLFDLHDIRGYDSIIPKQYADYMRAIEAQDDLLYNRIAPLYQRASLESPLLDLLGVRFVLTEDSIDTPGYALAFEQPGMRIYENTRAMPRVYRSSDVALVASSSFSQTIQQFDPRRVLIVDSCPREQRCDLSAAAARELPIPGNDAVEITVDKASEIWIDVQQTADDQWLVLNDSYFPGWRAWIRPRGAGNEREVETQIVRVNGNFRAVRLGPRIGNGEQTQALTVRFRYSPDSLRFGGFVSGLSVLGVLFALLIFGWRSLARDADSLSGAQRVARNSAVLSLMNIAGRLIAFASAIVIARIIGASGLGAYGTAVVLIGPFEILMNFGLNTWLTRQVAQDKPNAGAYFGFTTRLRLMLSALVVPLLLLLGLILFQAGYFDRSVALAFAILGVSQVISSVNTGLSALFFAFERGEIPAALSFFGALLTAALGVALLLTGIGIIALALTSILVNLVTLSVLSWQAWRTLGVQLTASAAGIPQSQRGLLREALPLMLNHLIPSIEYQLDVPLLKAAQPPALFFSGAGSPVSADSVAGWYYTGYRYLNAFNIVPSFFTQSFFPAMSRMAAQDGDALRVAFTLAVKLLVMLALPLAIAMTFLANWMAGIFGADFLPHAAVAVAIIGWSMVPGWINSLTNYALIAVNKQQLLIRAFVVTLIFNAIANLLVIPVYSYIGAAIVTIVSEIVKGAVFYYFVHQHLAQVNWVRVLAKPALAGAAMAAIAAGFMSIAQPLLGVLVGAAGYGVMLLALRAFDASELAILKPLVRRGK